MKDERKSAEKKGRTERRSSEAIEDFYTALLILMASLASRVRGTRKRSEMMTEFISSSFYNSLNNTDNNQYSSED